MSISAKDVMELRKQTGAGMMDCKKALMECDGDFTAAIKYLREKGIAAASKRAEREANEGLVVIVSDESVPAWAMVEVNSETDFVARNDEFIAIAEEMANQALKLGSEKAENNLIDTSHFDLTGLKAFAGKVGENLSLKRAAYLRLEGNGIVESYIHPGSQLGVLIEMSAEKDISGASEARELAHDLALQIAAAAPRFIIRQEVSRETIDNEVEIYKNKMRNEGKPEAILDKIAMGMLNKFYEDNCLLEQVYVKESKQKVQQRIAEVEKALGTKISVSRFVRFKID